MKNLAFYKNKLNCNSSDDVFNYLATHLKSSNINWEYFVNWEKVFTNTKKIEVALNLFNSLIKKENFDKEFKLLLKNYPQVAQIIPYLIVRDGKNTNKFNILINFKNNKLTYKEFDFSKKNISDEDIEMYLKFINETGLKNLIMNKKIKNFVDYMIGVEAGLDSNARKNRGGHIMENIIVMFITNLCKKHGFSFLQEANARKIKDEWNYVVPVDKSSRRYDFVINNGRELFIVETNFYKSGGSKLKSTAGEYRNLYDVLKGKFKFIWITDGIGWKHTLKPLRETFDYNDYVFTLKMLEKGVLEYLLIQD